MSARNSLVDEIPGRCAGRHEHGTGEGARARALHRRENRFSIRFNFTLTSAQFSLHGYWPFSSASGPPCRCKQKGRKRERKKERERDDDDNDAPRERLMHTAVARVFSKPSFPRNTPRPRPSSASFDLDRTTDRPFPCPTLLSPSFRSILFQLCTCFSMV